jgi:hypothetical protein
MTSPVKDFFDELARRGHVPWLEREHGSLRFEVVDAECVREWTVSFENGDVEVSQAESDVDAVVRADRALMDRLVCGEENLLAALLRGDVNYTGSLVLVSRMDRLLPGPAGQTGPRKVVKGNRRTG